ncbi:MAG: hypothetical protein QOE63_1091 [Acidimicrobiaceae bacterium]
MIAVDPNPTPRSTERFPCFDGLRAIAAGAVLLVHVSLISGFDGRHPAGLGQYFARAEAGVYLFFLISGYLLYRPFVAARFDQRAGPGLRSYARRRALRIIPAYWVALTVLALVFDTRQRRDFSSIADVVIYYGFLQIYWNSTVVGGLQQAWSLCTEASFYVFLPFWATLMRRVGRLRRSPNAQLVSELIGLAVLFAIGLGFRYAVVRSLPPGNTAVDGRLDWLPANADLFALGMVLAVVREWSLRRDHLPAVVDLVGRMSLLWWALAAICYWAVSTQIGLGTGVGADSPRQWMERQVLYAGAAFFLLLPAVFGDQDRGIIRRVLRARVMALTGLISYGIYLWHEGVIDVWMRARDIAPFDGDFPSMLAVAVVGTIALAMLSYVVVERPLLNRKPRERPREAVPA